jgi:hypothetical protein
MVTRHLRCGRRFPAGVLPILLLFAPTQGRLWAHDNPPLPAGSKADAAVGATKDAQQTSKTPTTAFCGNHSSPVEKQDVFWMRSEKTGKFSETIFSRSVILCSRLVYSPRQNKPPVAHGLSWKKPKETTLT